MRAVVIRGLPGTGKTTLGRDLASKVPESVLIDSDHDQEDRHNLRLVWLRWCEALANRKPLVIVTEPFPQVRQIEPYVRAAHGARYDVEVIRTPFPESVQASVERCSIPIAEEVVTDLLDVWEDYPGEIRALPEIPHRGKA